VGGLLCGRQRVTLAVRKTALIGTRRRSAPVCHISFGRFGKLCAVWVCEICQTGVLTPPRTAEGGFPQAARYPLPPAQQPVHALGGSSDREGFVCLQRQWGSSLSF